MLRVAFYSHDTLGLGHIRRCLKLIEAIRSTLVDVQGLLITGSPWAQLFQQPEGFEFLRLPPIVKRGDTYRPLQRGKQLAEVLESRRNGLSDCLQVFSPDLLIVDNVPCGLKGEMLGALRRLRENGRTRAVLALRDVLDRPDRIAREWTAVGAVEALESLYDEVWIFGDQQDLVQMSSLPGMSSARKETFGRIGIRDPGVSGSSAARQVGFAIDAPPPRVLVTGGGGGDAEGLVSTYVAMLRDGRPVRSRIVLGPDFPEETAARLETRNGFLAGVESFVPDLPAAMAGSNTICEIESVGRRAVLVPRVWPREEQLMRARRQEAQGRAIVLHPGDLTPAALWEAIAQALSRPAPEPLRHLGARNAALRAAELLDQEIRLDQERMAS